MGSSSHMVFQDENHTPSLQALNPGVSPCPLLPSPFPPLRCPSSLILSCLDLLWSNWLPCLQFQLWDRSEIRIRLCPPNALKAACQLQIQVHTPRLAFKASQDLAFAHLFTLSNSHLWLPCLHCHSSSHDLRSRLYLFYAHNLLIDLMVLSVNLPKMSFLSCSVLHFNSGICASGVYWCLVYVRLWTCSQPDSPSGQAHRMYPLTFIGGLAPNLLWSGAWAQCTVLLFRVKILYDLRSYFIFTMVRVYQPWKRGTYPL